MNRRLLLLFPSLILAAIFGFVQEDEPLKKIISQIEKYRAEYPQEKVHLHMDKPYYAIGDNIWFKAYVVNAEKNELSGLSKILYVDLINDKDSVKQSLKLPLNLGLAWGDFSLSDSLKEGNYRIRAYTTWMRNFGEEYFFDKTFTVGNSISNTVLTNVNYTFSKTGNAEKVVADIQYTDMDGKPLVNKEVNYNVNLDFRNISKGKATTNTQGNITITFVNNQPFILKSGKIITSIVLDEKNSVSKSFPVKSTSNQASVQFFPEGGELVTGIRTRVGFKAVGADGLGMKVSGYITDKSNNKLTEFVSEHAGMGLFPLHPLANETYTAHIKFEDGSEKTFDLPRIQPKGYVLNVNNTDAENLNLTITTSEIVQADAKFTLVAQTNGVVHFVAKNKLEAQSFNAKIPKKRFPTGILQLTVFSPANQPVSERLVFINHSDFLKINLNTPKTDFDKREKIKLSLDVKDATSKPVVGSFSVAVIDETKVPSKESSETTILSNLLLSSDLKGFIEEPNYYFSEMSDTKVRQLDLLLLTQGWRRFEWKSILSDSFPNLVYQPESNMEITGRVKALNGKPVIGGKVTLFSSSGDVFLMDTVTDAKGEFKFQNLTFSDSTKFIVQARNERDRKNVEIELDRIPAQLVTKNKNEPMLEINVNRSILPYLQNSKNQFDELRRYGLVGKSIMLAEVKVVEKKPVLKNSSNLNGAGNADAIIKSEDLQNCTFITQCIQGRVAGIVVNNGIVYSVRSMNSSFRGPVPMQIVIDGMMVEPEFISSINPLDVESIEVLKSGANTAIYGLRGGGGVLVINTKRPDLNKDYRTYAPGIISYNPKGFHKGREFYAPDYADPKINTKMADLRTTIYWNPNVVSDSTGKASVEFFNGDGPGTYKAIVEGIDINGKIGRQIYRYSVK
ncbi:TonB-dependent receptor plug domain-containing protein [Daejeonella lutea]|uniref:TonB-dependent outer membrane receptor, SusC/RagA subfamily, signature region n=1 Tax=Daejeonella lutea TaxID=572036 RepID=A0A1T5DXY3_9SPHI|nr:TonB-dependent receptor plug domain-containing protein [Daejeonella lutea]SKB76429.1 TonB-dependent outer membrane receptor, SusC/RagA subfamily, signature region [Daejeonella lutea]